MTGLRDAAAKLAVLLALGLIWEVGVRLMAIPPILVPPPSLVLAELWAYGPWFLGEAWITLAETLAGFGLAVLLGLALAIAMDASRLMERLLYPPLIALNAIPKVAVAPLFVIWLGTGAAPKIAMAVFVAIFSIVVPVVQGLRSVDPDMIDLGRVLGASRARMLRHVRLYGALPGLFSGMKIGVSLALVGAIIGEFIASSRGLGYVIVVAQGEFDTPRIFAAILLLALIGTLLFYMVDILERRFMPWHASQRGQRQ